LSAADSSDRSGLPRIPTIRYIHASFCQPDKPLDATTFIVGLLSGAAAGALLTGVFDLFNRGWERTAEKRDLRVGLAAEIRVGLQNVDPEERIHRTPEQELHFIAGNCFPWEFFKSNQVRIGLLPEEAASDVVEYHSLLWQFYEKAKVLSKWTEPDDTGERDALIAEIRAIMGRIRTVGGRALKALS
jgi:hypothetical protein